MSQEVWLEPTAERLGAKMADTHRWCDPPASHARHLEAALLHLLAGQLHVEVELVVAGAHDHMAALLREVGHTWVEFDVAVVLQSLSQSDELKRDRLMAFYF